MKFLKHSFFFLLLSVLIYSCASYTSKVQEAALTFPALGSIVKSQGHLWYATATQIGMPTWEEPVKVTVQELPFNKASYATYSQYMEKAGKVNKVTYVDSLLQKPNYVRLQLLDKIEITAQLNKEENKELRSYLKNDSDYKMMTSIDVLLAPENLTKFLEADAVFLKEDGWNKGTLLVVKGSQTQRIQLSEFVVFDAKFASFCWGEDIYHHKIIKALLNGNENCPQGTFNRASKIKEDNSYLKF